MPAHNQQDTLLLRNKVLDANMRIFSATLMGWGAYAAYPYTLYYPLLWVLVGILGYGALRESALGVKILYRDYIKRRSWQNLSNPISSKARPNGPTFAQRKAAGIYDGDSGALLGWDYEYDRPIFVPRNTTFRLGIAATGLGKTAGHVVNSVILSALKKGK